MNDAIVFFDFLDRKGLSPDKVARTLSKWTPRQLGNFLAECRRYVPYDDQAPQGKSAFRFVANWEMAGGSYPCDAYGCRVANADALSRFAALYADKVLIPNPLPIRLPDVLPEGHREQVANDLRIIYYYRPLFEVGSLGFVPHQLNVCSQCLKKLRATESILIKAAKEVIRPHLEKITATAASTSGYTTLHVEGPDYLFEHGGGFCRYDECEGRLPRGKETIVMEYLRPMLMDMTIQGSNCVARKANYLTNRELTLDLAQALNGLEVDARSKSLLRAFGHQVAFVYGVDIKKLIELREKEGEAFEIYRGALTRALKSAEVADEACLQELFADEVTPELRKIDLAIKNARSLFGRSVVGDVVAAAGFVAVGLQFGLFEQTGPQILSALGCFKFVSDIKGKLDQMLRECDAVKQNKYYFLWKVRKSARPI